MTHEGDAADAISIGLVGEAHAATAEWNEAESVVGVVLS
jgi:hypothetical protein